MNRYHLNTPPVSALVASPILRCVPARGPKTDAVERCKTSEKSCVIGGVAFAVECDFEVIDLFSNLLVRNF